MTEPGRYEFGDVRVDLRRMAVSVRGEPVALEPKSFDVLRYLIEHRDRLVGKDDLLDAVWGDTFVTPNVLTRAVAQLRRAIGDDAHDARYIETVVAAGVPVPCAGHRGSRRRRRARRGPAGGRRRARPTARGPAPGKGAILACWPPRSVALAAGAWWADRRRAPSPAAGPRPRASACRAGSPRAAASTPGRRCRRTVASVAYVSDRSGGLEIYVAGLAPGGREIAITSGGMQSMQPDWSPDGQWIAFHSRARRGVWIVPATGGVPRAGGRVRVRSGLVAGREADRVHVGRRGHGGAVRLWSVRRGRHGRGRS